jgi:hypothetical protein
MTPQTERSSVGETDGDSDKYDITLNVDEIDTCVCHIKSDFWLIYSPVVKRNGEATR